MLSGCAGVLGLGALPYKQVARGTYLLVSFSICCLALSEKLISISLPRTTSEFSPLFEKISLMSITECTID